MQVPFLRELLEMRHLEVYCIRPSSCAQDGILSMSQSLKKVFIETSKKYILSVCKKNTTVFWYGNLEKL